MSSFLSKLFDEKRLVKSVKVLPLSIKSLNPIQKYQYITKSYASILKILVMTINLSITILIYFEICSTTKLSNK